MCITTFFEPCLTNVQRALRNKTIHSKHLISQRPLSSINVPKVLSLPLAVSKSLSSLYEVVDVTDSTMSIKIKRFRQSLAVVFILTPASILFAIYLAPYTQGNFQELTLLPNTNSYLTQLFTLSWAFSSHLTH